MRVTIVIPTYNERENLRPLIERIARLRISNLDTAPETYPPLAEHPTNTANRPNSHDSLDSKIRTDSLFVIIVDDHSPDGTGALAEELAKEGKKKICIGVLHRPRKEGLGAALLAGFERALADGADIIVQMDADGSHESEGIPRMIREIERGADLVLGSRRVPGGRIIGWGWHRRIASWAAQTLSRHLLGLRTRDVTSGFRVWRAESLRMVLDSPPPQLPLQEGRGETKREARAEASLPARSDGTATSAGTTPTAGYAFQVEMVHRAEAAGLRIAEHPITFRDRERGRSKLGWRDVLGFFRACKRLWIGTCDRRFAFWLGVSLVILTSLPYLYGWLRTPPGHVYTGVHALASGDMAVYGSYIEQVRDGRWLFVDLFTSEWPQRSILNVLWLPVGLLGRITGLSTVLTFHLARVLLIIPLILFLARLVAAFLVPQEKTSGFFFGFPIRAVRRTALLFLAFSSGLGPLVADAIMPLSNARWRPGYDFWPPDLWVPESNTFLTLFQSPHFIASLWLLLYVILSTLRFTEARTYRKSIAAGIASLVLFQFHPFYVPTVAAVLAMWTIVESIAARRIRWDLVTHGAIVGVISAPSVLSHLWLLFKDPITIVRANQNLLFTTHWWLVALSYGFLVPLALIGIVRIARGRTIEARLLLVWLVATVILIYSPLTWQRRLIEGAHVVIVLIAIIGLFPLLSWLRGLAPVWVRRYAWSVTTATIIAIPLLGVSTFMNIVRDFVLYSIRFPRSIPHHSFYYPTDALEAMRWIRERAQLGEATFTVGIDGHFLPMYAARQTVLGHGVETTHFVEKYETSYALTGGQLSPAEARAFLTREHVRYILVTDASRGLWSIDPASIPDAILAYRNSGAEVYRLVDEGRVSAKSGFVFGGDARS